MKVLFFVDCLRSGGKERQLAETIIGLKRYSSIDCELVMMENTVHYAEIYETKIPIHVIERKFLKKDPRLFHLFYKIAKKSKPDIINIWDNMSGFYAIPAVVLLRIPMVNNEILSAPEKIKSAYRHKITFFFSSEIVANSAAGLRAYKQHEKDCKVVHNGFDFKRVEQLAPKESIIEKFQLHAAQIVGMVAAYSDFKDYATYVKAANIVLNKGYDVCFIGVGRFDRSQYQAMVDEKFRDRVKLMDQQKNVESIMNVCDIGVLSTFTEGLPNAVMEFMALKKPVVVTDGGGSNELVVEQETGFLVPQKSPEIMAEKIIFLLENKEKANEMGQKGFKRIEMEFSIDKMIGSYIEIFEDVLNKRKKKIKSD